MWNPLTCNYKCCILQQRWVFVIMGFWAMVTGYTMRVCISVAITAMVVYKNTTESVSTEYDCPDSGQDAPEKFKGGSFDWNEEKQGIILGAFYWGYTACSIPGGIVAQTFGAKWVLAIALGICAILTLLTPVVVIRCNYIGLIILRIIIGCLNGCVIPGLVGMASRWAPLNERALQISIILSGGQMGTVIANSVSGVLIHYTEYWSAPFMFFGGMGILWTILWILLCYDRPTLHPFITENEMQLFEETLGGQGQSLKIPYLSIITSVPVIALTTVQLSHDYGLYTVVTDLPKYMKDVLRFRIFANGLLSSLPLLAMCFCNMGCGVICKYILRKKLMGVTFTRKIFTTISQVGPGCCLIVASYVGCNRYAAVASFTLGMAFMGAYYSGAMTNPIDLAPNFASTLSAFTNGLSQFMGIAAPYVIGVLTPNHTLLEWRTVFWITGVYMVTANVVYIIFGSGEQQPWNDPEYKSPRQIQKEQQTRGNSQ